MTLYKNKYRIESARCSSWDYSRPGFYFLTTCVKDRVCLFGTVQNGVMQLNAFGTIVSACWFDLQNHYSGMRLDAFVVMPNHVHAVIQLLDDAAISQFPIPVSVETGLKPVSTGNGTRNGNGDGMAIDNRDGGSNGNDDTNAECGKRHGISEIMRGFKTFSARRINELRQTPGQPIWQPRFHDRIVRDGAELERIRQYIYNNPKKWNEDDLR